MSATPAALSLESLSKRFGRIRAVDHLSLDVEPGQIAGFLGPNGAGKSTTLYMISRLVHPTGGRIRVFGIDVWQDHRAAARAMGAMVEIPSFYGYLSARKNLELIANLRGDGGGRQIDELVERMGLADRQHDKVQTFSMGMKQRLGLGRALLGNPRLLVLDEPTNGMDPEGTREILSFLREKTERDGLTVFLSSHLLYEVEEYCDTVFVIDEGRLVASGNVREILTPHQRILRVTFDGSVPAIQTLMDQPQIEDVAALPGNTLEITLARSDGVWLNQYLSKAGYRVAALVPKQKMLKEFFFSITGEDVDA